MDYIFPTVLAFVMTFMMTPQVIKLANKIGAVDVPKDDRRVHSKPMPLIGGVGIYVSFIAGLLLFSNLEISKMVGLLLGSTLILVMGVFDDINDLPAKLKLAIQILAAGILIYSGFRITFITDFFGDRGYIYFDALAIPITFIWIVGITNTVNLIDGLDGLSTGVSTIAALTLGYIAHLNGVTEAAILLFILAGGCLGFLPYNFNPAKIFVGDTGALFLGFVLSAISIEGALKVPTVLTFAVPVLALGVPIFDTAFAIVRRKINGKPIMEADKEHLHHRFLNLGFGQKRTVLSIYVISILLGVSAVFLTNHDYIQAISLLFMTSLMIFIPLNREAARGRGEYEEN